MSNNICKKVVILGAQHPTGLATARSLRNCKVDIVGFFYSKGSFCERSNIWSSIVHVQQNPRDILNELTHISGDRQSKILLLPSDDESVKILSDFRDRLPENCIHLLPQADKVNLLLDKSRFHEWATFNNFPVPKTQIATSHEELKDAIDAIKYPVLLKPLYRNPEWDKHIPHAKVFIIENDDNLRTLPGSLFSIASSILVQQWIPGNDADIYFCLVYYNSHAELVDYFCGRKLLQWPPLGGSTAVAISDDNEETRDITLTVFNKIKYNGLGSIEYKKNPTDNKMYIMEPTVGRNDFQSYLAVTGNVNLTEMAYYDAIGEIITQHRKNKSIWISELSMYYSLKYYLVKRDFHIIKCMSKIFRSAGFSIFSIHDLRPFVYLLKYNTSRLISKIIRKNSAHTKKDIAN
jgi:D-aspartate ligase